MTRAWVLVLILFVVVCAGWGVVWGLLALALGACIVGIPDA